MKKQVQRFMNFIDKNVEPSGHSVYDPFRLDEVPDEQYTVEGIFGFIEAALINIRDDAEENNGEGEWSKADGETAWSYYEEFRKNPEFKLACCQAFLEIAIETRDEARED